MSMAGAGVAVGIERAQLKWLARLQSCVAIVMAIYGLIFGPAVQRHRRPGRRHLPGHVPHRDRRGHPALSTVRDRPADQPDHLVHRDHGAPGGDVRAVVLLLQRSTRCRSPAGRRSPWPCRRLSSRRCSSRSARRVQRSWIALRPESVRRGATAGGLRRATARRGRSGDHQSGCPDDGRCGRPADQVGLWLRAAREVGRDGRAVVVRLTVAITVRGPIVAIVIDASQGWPSGGVAVLCGPVEIAFAATGWLIAERRPENLIGPLLLSVGLAFGLYLLLEIPICACPARHRCRAGRPPSSPRWTPRCSR